MLVRVRIERAEADLGPLFAGLDAAIRALAAEYGDAELAAILDFSARANQVAAAQIAQVRRLTAERASASIAEPISP